MADSSQLVVCQQKVFAEDDCCRETVCGEPAAWVHRDSGSALCAAHEANARKWSGGLGSWRVAGREVPYPGGWEPVAAAASESGAAPAIDLGGGEVRPSGLVIERGPSPRA